MTVSERRNTMSKKDKKVEKKDAKITKGAQSPELSEADLDKVAGGATYSTSKSNIRGSK
jgi:hypothetical protein